MGMMKRLRNFINCKANNVIDELENPIEKIDLAIRKREEAVDKAKIDSADFVGSKNSHLEKLNTLHNKANEYELGIKTALKREDEEKARQYLMLKREIDTKIKAEEEIIKKIEDDRKQIIESIKNLEDEVEKLKDKKEELSARHSIAQAKGKVNEILADVKKDDNISINEIEEKITKEENYANGLEAFKKVDPDEELKKYISQDDFSIEDELSKYRKELK
ncbi:PspA/IM30 family protein (plasmid) [Clostridium perfringens]|nr:PspA/IM30 family protein [Clostridium perfringens]